MLKRLKLRRKTFPKIQKVLSVLFVMLLLYGLSACGGTSDSSPEEGSAQEASKQDGKAEASNEEENSAKTGGAASESEATSDITSSGKSGSEKPNGVLRAHFIDVGQGDSEFLELPDGKTMLIDGGSASSASTVSDYIGDLGYSRIDYLVATHPHEDHIGGLAAVINNYDIGEIWAPKVTHTTDTYEAFLDAVARKGLQIKAAAAGKQMFSAAGCSMDILSPAENASYPDLNDWSVVSYLVFGDTSFLFAGDAGSQVLDSCCPEQAEVLKVGHHGSETSTTSGMIQRLTPSYAIISCGSGNSYGHPHGAVLSLLEGIQTYRTDENGSIVLTSDGTTVQGKAAEGEAAEGEAVANPVEAAQEESEEAPAEEYAEPTPAPDSSSDPGSGGSGITVYITDTGGKYHLDGCRYLKSRNAISLEDAKARGYEACKVCNPPA